MNVITSFSEKGYETYGKKFISTFLEFWPKDYLLTVYVEAPIDIEDKRVTVKSLFDDSGVTEFLSKVQNSNNIFQGIRPTVKDNKQIDMYDYRYDAYRFCRKVFAITDTAKNTKNRFIWVDADVVTHSPIPENFIDEILPRDKFVAYLGRDWTYTETGFIAFNMGHEQADLFMASYDNMYKSGAFRYLGEWHDCYVFDFLRTLFDVEGVNLAEGLNMDHPFINTFLGKYMDHLKGPGRKKIGHSESKDIMVDHGVPYWRKSA